jgi:hypothetical protein
MDPVTNIGAAAKPSLAEVVQEQTQNSHTSREPASLDRAHFSGNPALRSPAKKMSSNRLSGRMATQLVLTPSMVA